MKLNEIAFGVPGPTQGSVNQLVDPNMLYSIRDLVMQGGAKPNTLQLVYLCRSLQMLQNGTFYKQTNPFESNLSTSGALMNELRAMPTSEILALAVKVYGMLQLKDVDSLNAYVDPTADAIDWMRLYQAREATD